MLPKTVGIKQNAYLKNEQKFDWAHSNQWSNGGAPIFKESTQTGWISWTENLYISIMNCLFSKSQFSWKLETKINQVMVFISQHKMAKLIFEVNQLRKKENPIFMFSTNKIFWASMDFSN